MPSFADSAVIFILALMLFGPKKLPQLARQLGKLMAEFRRASNEFRMQMEDELRIEEQKEHQKKVDAMAGPPSDLPDPEHPHLPATTGESTNERSDHDHGSLHDGTAPISDVSPVGPVAEVAPIAESGSLRMMPPSTGLPIESATYGTSESGGFDYHDPSHNPDAGSIRDESNGNQASNGSHASIGDHVGNGHHIIPEHSILPPAPSVGMSSEEPASETSRAEEQTHA